MFEKSIKWQGFDLKISSGHVANQADSAVWLSYGDTVVLATVVVDKPKKDFIDFLPLSVEYIEKFYASKRMPSGFRKREGKPQEQESLVARAIDRSIRPLLPKGLQNDIQVIVTVLSHDRKVGAKVPSLIAASAALLLSGLPVAKPVASVKIVDDFVCDPSVRGSNLSLYVTGSKNRIVSLQGWAKEVPYQTILKAVSHGMKAYQPVIEILEQIKVPVRKDLSIIKPSAKCIEFVEKRKKDIEKAAFNPDKKERNNNLYALKKHLIKQDKFGEIDIKLSFEEVERRILVDQIIKKNKRFDNRKIDEVRKISAKVNVLPTMHGSCLFSRGDTQVLSVLTIGEFDDARRVDNLHGYAFRSFMFHYNFPPFAVGETDRLGPPSRRELGHGNLAWHAISRMLPQNAPYVFRIVSEVLASNGSSSMASVCAASLALMQAGIDIQRPVAGVALGALRSGANQYETLVDLLGDEDHLGLMDCKISGTTKGINSLQMDVKDVFMSHAFLSKVFKKGQDALLSILTSMNKVLKKSAADMPHDVSRAEVIHINTDKIYELIGKNGKIIRDISYEAQCKIDVMRESGQVLLTSQSWKNIYQAKKLIRKTIKDPDPKGVFEVVVADNDEKGSYVCWGKSMTGYVPAICKKGSTIQVLLKGFDRKGDIILTQAAS